MFYQQFFSLLIFSRILRMMMYSVLRLSPQLLCHQSSPCIPRWRVHQIQQDLLCLSRCLIQYSSKELTRLELQQKELWGTVQLYKTVNCITWKLYRFIMNHTKELCNRELSSHSKLCNHAELLHYFTVVSCVARSTFEDFSTLVRDFCLTIISTKLSPNSTIFQLSYFSKS